MRKILCYIATMLVVFTITDFFVGGSLLRLEEQAPDELSVGSSIVNNTGIHLQKQKDLGELIASQSCEFVQAAFAGDKARVYDMLCEGTVYLVSEDKSSYIRYVKDNLHVEGYMATDKKLAQVRQKWFVIEDEDTIISGVEVKIGKESVPQMWYIHYKKCSDSWKIFMLENGV